MTYRCIYTIINQLDFVFIIINDQADDLLVSAYVTC